MRHKLPSGNLIVFVLLDLVKSYTQRPRDSPHNINEIFFFKDTSSLEEDQYSLMESRGVLTRGSLEEVITVG